jgi:hypothetical protein
MEAAEASQRGSYFDTKRRANDTGISSRAANDASRRQGSMEAHNASFAARDYAKERKDDFHNAARSSHFSSRQEHFLADTVRIDTADRAMQAGSLATSVDYHDAEAEELDKYNHNKRSGLRQQQADIMAAREQQRDVNAARSAAERKDTLSQSTLDSQTREAYREAKADYDQTMANQGYEKQRDTLHEFITSRTDADAVHRMDSIKSRHDAKHQAFVEESEENEYVAAVNAKHFSDLNRRDNRLQDQFAAQDREGRMNSYNQSRNQAASAEARAEATEQANQDSFHQRAQNSRAELDHIIRDASTSDISTRNVAKLSHNIAKGNDFTTSADMSYDRAR